MDCVSPIFSITAELWDCTAKRSSHVRDLRENLECLREEMELLNRRSEDVKTRVERAKLQQMTPTVEVEGWLQDVGKEKNEVVAILQEGDGLMQKKCLGRCLNIRLSNDLGKRVNGKISRVKELTSRGREFTDLAGRSPSSVVEELPLAHTVVGLDSLYEEVCSCLAEHHIGIVGLYGKRGIGKTTLIKKINNGLLGTSHGFDTVIWVSLPEQASACVGAVQQVMGNKLQIIDNVWHNQSQDERAIEIFSIMKTKRFLLLLDDVKQSLDLSAIGVPSPDDGNKSKVIVTTRSRSICSEMKVNRWLELGPLSQTEARTLFNELIEKDTVNSSPRIRQLVDSILETCQGFPSAIVRAGRALAACNNVMEWEHLTQELEDLIKKEISGEYRLPQAVVDEMPGGHMVGLESLYGSVCKCLSQYEGVIIGLYGTGGVGKTTFMKKINNEFLKQTSYHFDIVIWVSVSKLACVKAAQEVILNKLQIPGRKWQNRGEDERAVEIFNILKTKRFVLLLDDVWQQFSLSKIGVPPLSEIRNGSKVIITTRSLTICDEMEVPLDRRFRVEMLPREEALALFQEKVGENTLNSHPHIQQLSKKVAVQCKGLPLALVTVGRAMANKNSPQQWDQAIQELEAFPLEISGVEDELFRVLKLSYDRLRDDITKSCFVYCSFFPKEYEIRNDELIEHWIGEGFFYGKDIYEARRRGHKIIEELKNACLLEVGGGFKECIKMHDVIHDMALWIAQECGKNMNRIWVCESLGLVDRERVTNWKVAEKILLWGQNIEKLPKNPSSSHLKTLFVRECIQLKTFAIGFFHFMPLLRVLDLSATPCLSELPDDEIGRLTNLEYINLSMTNIRELPTGIMKLSKLRCLLLDGMPPLIVPPNVISSLPSLQLFSMYDGDGLSAYRQHLLEELDSIETLDELSLSFRSSVALFKLMSSHKLQRCIRRLSLHDCRDLFLLELSSILLNYLEILVVFNCLQLEEIKINIEKEDSKGFEQSYDTPIPDLIVRNNQHFHRLRDVKIWSCPKLLNLTWIIYATHLESLNVQFCKSMKEVISKEYVTSSAPTVSIFARLTSLAVGTMPMLENIYQGVLLFPSLEAISVISCPRLQRLPFHTTSAAKSLKKIEGDITWWNNLKWEDESVKNIFNNYFSPQYLADPIQYSDTTKEKSIEVPKEGSSKIGNSEFTFPEVDIITNNFTHCIGTGRFGKVYLGTLANGITVAVKIWSRSSKQDHKEFRAEAEILMRVNHKKLVRLIGYCKHGTNMALIYEYMSKGNLRDKLLGKEVSSLNWKLRLQTAIDVAEGLEYLRNSCKPAILLRDLKSSNILFNDLEAKISDIGMSTYLESGSFLSTAPVGTSSYLDPEKSEACSFGIVLLELITGRPAIWDSEMARWVRLVLEEWDIRSIVDSRLQGDFITNSAWKATEIAITCVASTEKQRPDMNQVLIDLKECLGLKESHWGIQSARDQIINRIDQFLGDKFHEY